MEPSESKSEEILTLQRRQKRVFRLIRLNPREAPASCDFWIHWGWCWRRPYVALSIFAPNTDQKLFEIRSGECHRDWCRQRVGR